MTDLLILNLLLENLVHREKVSNNCDEQFYQDKINLSHKWIDTLEINVELFDCTSNFHTALPHVWSLCASMCQIRYLDF